MEELQKKAEALDKQTAALRKQRAEIENKRPPLNTEDAIKTIQGFGDILDRGNYAEIRLVLETLIDRIDIDGDEIYIRWRFT